MAIQQQRPGNELSQLSPGEMLAGIIVFAPLLSALPLLIGDVRHRVWAWLIQHQLVVPTQAVAIVDGVGLDAHRILILVGMLGLALTVGYATVRHRLQRGPVPAGRPAGRR